jgi:glycosyltransferase involved in cell wall biosynthesis
MAKKMKILMIALQHRAKDDRIFYKEALSLKKNGFAVSYLLLTDEEGYIKDMSGVILNEKGENNFFLDGVKIIGIKPPSSFITSMLNKIFLGKFQKEIISSILKENANIYHAHEPISLRVAMKASKISNNKVIYDSHESWVGGTIKDQLIKKKYLKKIKYLITVNGGILENLSRKANFTCTKIIYNCSLPSLFPFIKGSQKINTPIVLVHEGTLSFNRGLKNMLQALLLLRAEFPDIKLKIIGDSPRKESAYISKFLHDNDLHRNIIKTGWVKYEDVAMNLKNCDIGLILYSPSRNNLFSTSNKLFNYISSGLAIVSVDLPETKKIISPLNNGVFIENHEGNEIAEAISSLIKDPKLLLEKKIASQIAYQKYNWSVEEKKLIDFYKKVLTD